MSTKSCYIFLILGALISISLFSRRLKWDDSVLGLISIISKIIGALATGFARNSMEMYIGWFLNFIFYIIPTFFIIIAQYSGFQIHIILRKQHKNIPNITTIFPFSAVAVEMFNATSFTALRSISSKMCTSDELGKYSKVKRLSPRLK